MANGQSSDLNSTEQLQLLNTKLKAERPTNKQHRLISLYLTWRNYRTLTYEITQERPFLSQERHLKRTWLHYEKRRI